MVKSVDTRDLKQFEPPRGNARSETRQIRRTPPAPCPANAEPSLPVQEGVESRRRAPKAARPGRRRAPAHERRLFLREKPPAAKAEAGRKSLAARRAGSIPASGTTSSHPPAGGFSLFPLFLQAVHPCSQPPPTPSPSAWAMWKPPPSAKCSSCWAGPASSVLRAAFPTAPCLM